MGRGANQSCGMVSLVGDGSVSDEVGESDSMESPVVMYGLNASVRHDQY